MAQSTTTPAPAAKPDSLQKDSVAPFVPKYTQGFPPMKGNDSTIATIASLPVMEVPEGKTPTAYSHGPLYDTGAMGILLLVLFLIVLSYRTGYKYIQNFATNLFSVRLNSNMFDDNTTSDVRIMMALVLNTCVMEAFLLFYGITHYQPQLRGAMTSHVFTFVAALTGIAIAFHLAQHALLALLGYVFSDAKRRMCWLTGFLASQSILGILLFPVVVMLLVFPSSIATASVLAISLYILIRIVFIFKGFRIFFNKISASVYFILYLCSVEIIPPVIFCVGAAFMCCHIL